MPSQPTCLLAAFVVIAATLPALAADGVSDPIPFTPYGMDAVPGALFYSQRWDRYGSDPVPAGITSDFGFRDVYGLDAIPEALVPSVHDHIRQVFPHHFLEVLTGEVSEFEPRARARKSTRRPARSR
jgi:hypothetical protein